MVAALQILAWTATPEPPLYHGGYRSAICCRFIATVISVSIDSFLVHCHLDAESIQLNPF
jgi:hypothetical protein